jgi:hypothetical protein
MVRRLRSVNGPPQLGQVARFGAVEEATIALPSRAIAFFMSKNIPGHLNPINAIQAVIEWSTLPKDRTNSALS